MGRARIPFARSSSGFLPALLCGGAVVIGSSSVAVAQPRDLRPVYVAGTFLGESRPLAGVDAASPDILPLGSADVALPRTVDLSFGKPERTDSSSDAALSIGPVHGAMAAPSVSFDGLSNANNDIAWVNRFVWPNVSLAVGPGHIVEYVNSVYRVYSKTGVELTNIGTLNWLFPTSSPCYSPSKKTYFARYDALADRWLLGGIGSNSGATLPLHACFAVSTGPEPNGSYYLYDFTLPGSNFPEYARLGVWPDGYYLGVTQYLNGTTLNGGAAYALDRYKMLAGDPSAGFIYFDLNATSHPEQIIGLTPSDLDGLIPPPPGRPNTFAFLTAFEFGDAADGLRLFDFHADFATPANSTFTERQESSVDYPFTVAAFDGRTPSGFSIGADIRQPAPATDDSALDAWPYYMSPRLQYRSNGTVESLVLSHTVGAPGSNTLGTYRAGVRYYQLTRTIADGWFEMLDQATWAPDDGVHRFLSSSAVDNRGNLALGYSAVSTSVYPSLRYAGRLASDPPGALSQGESTLVNGSGVQTAASRAFGMYTSLTLDPVDDCTFWMAGEYYTAASQGSDANGYGWLTRIGSFRFPECVAPASGRLQGTVRNTNTNATIAGARIVVSNGFEVMSDMYGVYARTLTPGTYTVTVLLSGYATRTLTDVVISDGATTTLDIQLEPVPVLAANGLTLLSENLLPANGVPDPGETVTLNFSLANAATVPGAWTTNLTAEIQWPVDFEVLPSDAVFTFGSILPGQSASRPITLRLNPTLACGATVTASLMLFNDGHPYRPTFVPFTFSLGASVFAPLQYFDGVTAPALPSGWTATNTTGPAPPWVTSTSAPDSGVNTAFVDDPSVASDKRLDSPAFLAASGSVLSFRHSYSTEANYDGGVLEISIAGGAFTDIIAAGGSWVTGGYNRTISALNAALGGRSAWSGNSQGYVTTTVNLPPAAAGKMVTLRFRFASDSSSGGVGWRVDTISLSSSRTCTPVPALVPYSVNLTAESFAPANRGVDPGEVVTVDLGLKNVGSAASTALTATLLPSADVLEPSGPASYGVIPVSTGVTVSVSRPFTFRANPLRGCAVPLTATLALADGGVDLGTASFGFLPVPSGTLSDGQQEFDTVVAPALPAGWAPTNAAGPAPLWLSTPLDPYTAPNAAFVDDAASVSDKRLTWTYPWPMPANVRVMFRNKYVLEAAFDGAVLEMSINGGPFVDIVDAGGTVVSGGYNSSVSNSYGNPIGGRAAWTGDSGGYVVTAIDLPVSTVGQSVAFRWRMGSDSSVGWAGWWVDGVRLERECAPAAGEFTQNGTFSSGADGTDNWLKYATPDMSYMPWNVTDGVFQFYRASGGTQAVAFQQTGVPVPTLTPIEAAFDLGNSMNVRRRISVLLHDSNFTDLSVCTFWLPPNLPLSTYRMRMHTSKAWTNATVSFYAASVGQDSGGFYRLDNVSVRSIDGNSTVRTDCLDPTLTAAAGTSSGELLTNGSFSGGTLSPWGTYGNLSWQLANGEFNFFKLPGAPAGVVLQGSGASAVTNQRMLVTFQAGNSSAVRQRMTVLLHDANFSDLSACTFWLAPGAPMATYGLRTYATQPWTNATASVYPATAGSSPTSEWLRLDSVSLTKVTSTATGTECFEPGSVP